MYIEYYKKFENPLLENWNNNIKPYILEKYPKTSTRIFTQNSDLHYIIDLIDDLKEKYKVIKEDKFNEIKIKNIPNKEDNGLKNDLIRKKPNLKKKEDINTLKDKIQNKIVTFLDDFIEENKIKRSNSMMSLRNCKTISSFTTCDDSICYDDNNKKEGKIKINLNQLLIIDNSEIYQRKKKIKDIIQRSKNLNQINLEKKVSQVPETKNKLEKLKKTGQINEHSNLLKTNMIPKYRDKEEEMEKVNIEYKDKNKTILNYISVDLLLKKIIFQNFIDKNTLLIYHFCQQCFCFVSKDIFFKKLFDCYHFYKNKKIPFDVLKNLIEFINILVVEMFEYYDIINYKEMCINHIKEFYKELIIDIISNISEDKNKIENKKNDINNNNIETINIKRIFRFNSFDINEGNNNIIEAQNNSNVAKFDKNNLINTNLNFDVKNINIFILKDKENSNNNEQNGINEIGTQDKNSIKGLSKNINIEFNNIFKISKTLRTTLGGPNIYPISNKYLGKIDEEIKEENNEDEGFLSDDEIKENPLVKEANEQEEESFEDLKDSDEEDIFNMKIENDAEEKNKSEIINNFLGKVFINNDKIITKKEEILIEIKYINSLLYIKDKETISSQSIREAKTVIPFYTDIKSKKKTELNNNNIIISGSNKYKTLEKSRASSAFPIKSKNLNLNTIRRNYFYVKDWTVEEIGNKLTQISKNHLNKICRRELYRGIYLKEQKQKQITSPNVVKCISHFNKLTSFIIEDIISFNTPKLRAKIYKRWVKICYYCLSIKNYNDCLAIFSALNNYIISGLNLTLKEVKSKIKVKFEQMSKFCSCDGNYKNIRNDMNLCEKNGESFIPYLGMLLKDINFFEESGKYLNEKGCINMDKIEKINDLFDKYFKYKKDDKKNKPDIKYNKELAFFDNLEIISEEELEKIANNVEPEFKYDKIGDKRLTNIDKKCFDGVIKKRCTIAGTRGSLEKI